MDKKPLVAWNEDLSVGIQEIDEQHMVIIDLINQLHFAIVNRQAREVAYNILVNLEKYSKTHFMVEESLMRMLEYPQYEEHKKSHDLLIAQIVELRERLSSENTSVSFELLHFLKKWLTIHIQEEDKAYTEHFLNCGVKRRHTKRSWLARLW